MAIKYNQDRVVVSPISTRPCSTKHGKEHMANNIVLELALFERLFWTWILFVLIRVPKITH